MGRKTQGSLRRPFAGAAFGLVFTVLAAAPAVADTVISLSWDQNTEADVAGYRLRYGTSPGINGSTVDVGFVTSYSLHGLDTAQTYYFVVHAYDYAGNVSAASNEASGQPSIFVGPLPTIASATELTTSDEFLLQSGRHDVRVQGTNFQSGASVDLGSSITAGAASLSGTTSLRVTLDVGATAALGPRTLTVQNPDGGSGSRSAALSVIRNCDITRDCKVDGGDLNAIARGFNAATGAPAYAPAADLDGDGMIDGVDLDLFATWFGRALAVCP